MASMVGEGNHLAEAEQLEVEQWGAWWPRDIGVEMTESAERRGAPRYAAQGAVQLSYTDAVRREIAAELLDVSRYGFRVRHDRCSLRAGQIVRFRRAQAGGEARVVWTHRTERGCESGCAVLSEEHVQ